MANSPARISALIVARDEAENLTGCLESLAWADEIVVVVDARSGDDTEAIARRMATRVLVRPFDDFAGQRNAALDLATGDWVLAVDADERATAELASEIRRILGPDTDLAGFRVPIRSFVLGRSFGYSGTQHDLPLRLFRRDLGRWEGAVHETVDLRGRSGQLLGHLTHRTLPDMQTFLAKINHYTTLEAVQFRRDRKPFRWVDLAVRPAWTFAKLYLGKQGFRDGLEGLAFCGLSGFSVAVRHWKHRELLRDDPVAPVDHDAIVGASFDESEGRFKAEVAADDIRLRAVLDVLGPLHGRRVLDLGCGKGRFAAHLRDRGAEVIGIDLSASMLAAATGMARVRASARRLPFADGTFDAVVAIEVLEHVGTVDGVLDEARRVLKPGGCLAIVDKNAGALDARRPWLPSLLVKWIDERRGLWMYPSGGPVRERWFWPGRLARKLRSRFGSARVEFLLRPEEVGRRIFRAIPKVRLMTLWSARVPDVPAQPRPDIRKHPAESRPEPHRRPRRLAGNPARLADPAREADA